MKTFRRCFPVVFMLALAAIPRTSAQQNASASDANKEEAIRLSPFEVRAVDNRGYVASETLTGTRVATQIKDLPYTVNVVTSEFFEDFGMFQLDDTLTQIGGLTGLDIGGGFNLRGFSSTSQLRDGFYRLGRYGETNIDRIEVIKGPNAGIYGRTSPGGMVNMISKAPKKQTRETLTARYGSFDTSQGTLEATGTMLDPNTSYILILSQFNRAADMDWFHIRENQGFLAVKHDFQNHGHLTMSAEYFMQYRNAPQPSAPIVTDQKGTAATTDDQVIGYARNLAKVNPYGPNSSLFRGSNTLFATYDQPLNDIFAIRLGGQLFQAKRWDYNQNTGWGGVAINSATAANNLTSTRGAVPNRGLIFETGGGFQGDLVANYKLFNGAVTNKTLLTLDFNDYYRYDPTKNSGATAALAAWGAAGSGRIVALNPDFSPVLPVTSFFTASLASGGQAAPYTRLTRRRATVAGGQFRQESHWLKDSLLTYFGARYDHVHFNERDYVANINGVTGTVTNPVSVKRDVTQVKPNVGALYKIRESFRVYANYSESYFINQTDNPSDIANATYKPETAKGYDFGFKGSFLNDRLNYTIGGYYIERFAVRVTDSVEISPGQFQNITRPDGNQLDRGFELDVNWNINRAFSTGLSYGKVNAVYTDFGSAYPRAVGRRVQNISPSNGGAYLKYNGSGTLHGFSANIGVTYVERTPTESPNAGDPAAAPNGVQAPNSTNQWALTVPSFTLWNLGASYTWGGGSSKFDHTIRLNVNNVFDRDYLKVNKNIGDARGIYVTYTLGLMPR
jgi:outer membrane receptor protein involved in Fe transport